jgi:hypothetical protein
MEILFFQRNSVCFSVFFDKQFVEISSLSKLSGIIKNMI